MDHFNRPRNVGKLENADGQARVGDPNCGDFIQVWIQVENDIITDFKYKVYGCGAAIATTSAVSEMAIGKSFREAIQLSDDDVIAYLDGLPEGKRHCSLLGVQGLHTAMADNLLRKNHAAYCRRLELFAQAGLDLLSFHRQAADLIPVDAQRVLHVGTGHGLLPIEMAQRKQPLFSIDVSAAALHVAQLNAVHYGVDEKVDLQQIDILQANFPPHSFNAVVVLAALHHIAQTESLLQICSNLLEPRGFLVLGDWNSDSLAVRRQIHRQQGRHCDQTGWSSDRIFSWLQENGWHFKQKIMTNRWWFAVTKKGD